MAFEMVSDICRVVGAALLIDYDRQIAAHPNRIHVVEEEETIAAKQILHIVLGGRDEDVDALVFEQGVESRRVEGRVLCLVMSKLRSYRLSCCWGSLQACTSDECWPAIKTASILALIYTFLQ